MVWEQSIRIAILLRLVLAVSCTWDLPFGLCRREEAQGAQVIMQHLGPGVRTPDEARQAIHDRRVNFRDNTLVLFVPTEATLTSLTGTA